MTTQSDSRDEHKSLLDRMYEQEHIVITASLEIANGHFLQPTGFPDIDACIYRDKEGKRWCLVESEQSMTNRLEAVCMKSPGVWIDDLKGLPVIAVRNKDGDLLTTNLTEPHRIASSYVLDGKRDDNKEMKSLFEQKLGLKNGGDFWPLDKRSDLEKLVFALDPGALLHGFQFVQWKFVGLRQTRLVHARLEAELADESEVNYGMVKWDAIEPESTQEKRANKGQSIAAKSRIVPKEIAATFEIDVLGLKNLALEELQKKFLLGLALWKVGAFLNNKPSFDARSRQTGPSLRLRSDCYLRCGSISWSGSPGTDGAEDEKLEANKLMAALPTGFKGGNGNSESSATSTSDDQHLDFRSLVAQKLKDDKKSDAASEPESGKRATGEETEPTAGKREPFYDGPVVEVTYEPKPKKERGAGAQPQATAADDGPADDQQG
ncbi:MAG: type I-U CRISPR-associated protein Cas7 [Deltaproteobacteria bacterium]|nr:type I-U CRISPR-associated protein Cas7 [Deltaproteobacteria bacterium]